MSIIPLNIPNPDSASVASKQTIDISFSEIDVSASMSTGSIKANYNNTGITIVSPRYEEFPVTDGRVYYTPTYTEQFSYQQWLTTINKTFVELN